MKAEDTYDPLSQKPRPVLQIALLVVFLVAVVAFTNAFWPRYEERFFELALLGKYMKAEDYYPYGNSTLKVGSPIEWYIYIHNHMGSVQEVSVRVKLLNSTTKLPDDREHEPSPIPFFAEVPVQLGVDDTVTVPFSWKVLEAESQNDSIRILRLLVNDEIFDLDVMSISHKGFRLVFELWVYDESEQRHVFWWNSGNELHSASLIMWFAVD